MKLCHKIEKFRQRAIFSLFSRDSFPLFFILQHLFSKEVKVHTWTKDPGLIKWKKISFHKFERLANQ